jgi:hypothetical protein
VPAGVSRRKRAGSSCAQAVQKVEQVVGILSGGIEADEEVDWALPLASFVILPPS